MQTNYFSLSPQEQSDLISSSSNAIGTPANILEKDLWVCWALKEVFKLPMQMSFKGGTSLSKAFNLIDRFSEDIDITIDYRNINDTIDFTKTSRSQLKKVSNQLKTELKKITSSIILPHLEQQADKLNKNQKCHFKLSDNGEKLEIHYPSVLNHKLDYLRSHVLLEFGIRNSTEPSETHKVKTLLSKNTTLDNIMLPAPDINVLSPIRTYWEKATLIHVECHRNRLQAAPERLSRHWYDLAQLEKSWVGPEALKHPNILHDVIDHKKAFFNASYAHYDDCLSNKFRIIPSTESLQGLIDDYHQMQQAGLFSTQAPDFSEIKDILAKLEVKLRKVK